MLNQYLLASIDAFYHYTGIPLWVIGPDNRSVHSCVPESLVQADLTDTFCELADQLASGEPYAVYSPNHMEIYYCFSFHAAVLDTAAFDAAALDEVACRSAGQMSGQEYLLAAGPALLVRPKQYPELKRLSFSADCDPDQLRAIAEELPLCTIENYLRSMRLAMLLMTGQAPGEGELYIQQKTRNDLDHFNRLMTGLLFNNREQERTHNAYRKELLLFNYIEEGNVARLKELMPILKPEQVGTMSKDPFRQALYTCICSTTIATRFALEGGLDDETAYSLSDAYIQKFDLCRTQAELYRHLGHMYYDFAEQVARSRTLKQKAYSHAISQCMDYIYTHAHSPISLDILAELTGLTPKYLSERFRRETGGTLTDFITEKRIQEARNLLVYSDYSLSRISSYLQFHSQSYFTAVFRRCTGMTPGEYRNKYGNPEWSGSHDQTEE